jgi:RNA polymerase sigma-70 factor (ECF subfamily)
MDDTRSVHNGPTFSTVDSDLELLNRLRAGDETAFVELVSRYQQPLLRLARAFVPNEAVAEEAVQDTWVGVVRGIDRFAGRSSFKTWLFAILVNRARSAGVREHRSDALEPRSSVDPDRFDNAGAWSDPPVPWAEQSDDRLDAAAWIPVLKIAIDELPERQRQVVIMRDIESLTTEEVCEVLGISRGNQRILLHRGRSQLRAKLEQEFRRE